jgi:MoaA/NifB/PqqE/SkfB family radical SAM enzyme
LQKRKAGLTVGAKHVENDKRSKEYLEKFNKKVVEQRVPFSGSIDLTHRCNLNCVHCYIGDKTKISGDGKQEIDTGQWISILDEIVEAGCLNLLITGGEPLLRKDFVEIYRHAKTKGMLITVFTNGTLITEEILDTFKQLPPRAVEITLYGNSRNLRKNNRHQWVLRAVFKRHSKPSRSSNKPETENNSHDAQPP